MFLAFKVATEAVCAQHLQQTEEHKQRKTVYKMAFRRHFGKMLQAVIILENQLAAQFERIFCTCLPQKRSKVVVVRTFATALEINELWISVGIEHNVPCLEVAIKKGFHLLRCKVFCKHSEVGL